MQRHWSLPIGPLKLDVSATTGHSECSPHFSELDPLLLDPDMLSVMAVFTTGGWYRVKAVGEGLGLPADDMSRRVARLRNLGCVNTRTGTESVEWMQATRTGAVRLASHVAALHDALASARRLLSKTGPQ